MKDVIIGWMSDQRVNDDSFGKRGKIVHEFILHCWSAGNPLD
jgi:hypothetical protein